jgi:hypothetical protein
MEKGHLLWSDFMVHDVNRPLTTQMKQEAGPHIWYNIPIVDAGGQPISAGGKGFFGFAPRRLLKWPDVWYSWRRLLPLAYCEGFPRNLFGA